MDINFENGLAPLIFWPPSFSIAFLGQQKTHGQLTAANEISVICIFSRNRPDVRSGTNYIYIYYIDRNPRNFSFLLAREKAKQD